MAPIRRDIAPKARGAAARKLVTRPGRGQYICIPQPEIMQEYEFRIFPPARPYSPPDGAQVFVKLNSDKHTGLGTLVPTPEGESKTSAADPDHHVPKIIAVDHEANCQGEDASSSAPAAVLTDAGIAATQLPPGITAEGRRLVQYAVGGSAYVRPARFTPVRPTPSHASALTSKLPLPRPHHRVGS